MNIIYRIVWNCAKGEWMVASELATAGHGGKSTVQQDVHAPASMLRRLPWALACVFGGLAVCAPAVHAGDAASAEHQHMEKINSRLADLSDLMVKYGSAQTQVADRVAPSEVATNPSVLPGRGLVHVASHASVRADAATRPVAATPTARRVVKMARHVTTASHAVKSPQRIKPHAAPPNALSPQLASDTQIAAIMASRNAPGSSATTAGTSSRASTWVIGADGSLHVTPTEATAPKAVAGVATGISRVTQARTARSVASDADQHAVLPAIGVSMAAETDAPIAGRIATVDAAMAIDVASTIADARLPEPPEAPAPGLPQTDATSHLVANVSTPVSALAASTQTSGLVLDTDPAEAHLPLAVAGGAPVEVRTAATAVGRQGGGDDSSSHADAPGFRTASVGAPVRYSAVDTGATDTGSAVMSHSMSLSSLAFSSVSATPMALPPNDPRRPPAADPTAAPWGTIVGTGGLLGNVGGALNPTVQDLLSPNDPYLHSGQLNLASVNITQTYQSLGIGQLGLVNLTPVGDLINGTLMGYNQHLTLLGGVTSDSYITHLNRGVDGAHPGTQGGLLGLLLPDGSPAWSDTCASLLGIPLAQCWAVNAAQNNQVIIGDNASANGSEEVVIGTGASHTLPLVDADVAFPGDGDRNSATDPMGVPDSDYQSRMGHSVVIGDSASGTQDMQTILGANATSDQINSVALGYGSNAGRGPLSAYTNAYGLTGVSQDSAGVVAVGNTGHERQITHVAAGTDDHDAVNVLQLKGAVDSVADVGKLAVKYDDDGTGNPSNTVTLIGDGTGSVAITNLAPGAVTATSTDAVNGSQLNATNTSVANYFGGATHYDGGTNTWTPPDFQITNIALDGTGTVGDYNNVTDAFSALDTSLVNVNKRITNNSNGLKYFKANSTGADASAAGSDSVAMGGDTVAAGNGSVAAGNGAQAKTDGAVAIGQDASADGGQAVAIGNGAQATGDGAVSIGDPNVVAGDGAVGLGKDNTVTGDGAVALGNTNTATGVGAITMGNTSSATADGAVAIGNDASSSVAGGVALGEGSVAARSGGGMEAFTNIAVPTVGAISVGSPGKLRQITNVAGGTEDTDAVNVRQLKAVADTIGGVDKLAVKYDADVNGDPTNTVTLVGNGTGPILITNVAPGAVTATSLDAINGAQLYDWTQSINNKYSNLNLYKYIQNLQGGGAFAVNDTNNLGNPAASGDNSAAGGAGTVASGTDSTAVGNGARATASNSVALGTGSVADRANTVSVGSVGHERQIVNVAAGTQATDAVNVAQLQASANGTVRYDTNKDGSTNYESVTLGKPGGGGGETVIHNVGAGVKDTDAANVGQLADMKSWAQQYSNQQYSDLSRQLNDMGNRAFAGVASAMAMAGLPQAYLPGKSMASIAGSSFHGESSIAIGVSLISDNGRWVYKLNGTDNSRGDAGVSMGVGIQW